VLQGYEDQTILLSTKTFENCLMFKNADVNGV